MTNPTDQPALLLDESDFDRLMTALKARAAEGHKSLQHGNRTIDITRILRPYRVFLEQQDIIVRALRTCERTAAYHARRVGIAYARLYIELRAFPAYAAQQTRQIDRRVLARMRLSEQFDRGFCDAIAARGREAQPGVPVRSTALYVEHHRALVEAGLLLN